MARYKFTTSGNYITFKDTDNVVATLHNTSRAVEWKYDSTGGLTWWVDNIKYQTDNIANIEFDGVACNSQDDFETGIEAMFPNYAEAEGGSVVGYPEGTKMYLALLTQSGTNAPVATVLVNTLGGTLVWSYDDIGRYTATLSGAFTANKTFVFPVPFREVSGDGSCVFGEYSGSTTSAIKYYLWDFGAADFKNGINPASGNIPIQILVLP